MLNPSKILEHATDPMAFAESLVIPTPSGPLEFGVCMAPQQREILSTLAASQLAVARSERPPVPRAWIEMTAGWGKDLMAAVVVLWLLAFSSRKLMIRIYAVDADQARLVKESADDELRLNPYLTSRIKTQNNRLINEATGSECTVVAADEASAHGDRPDFVVISEISRFPKRKFFDAAMTNVGKKSTCVLAVFTNAGNIEHFSYQLRKEAIASPRWLFKSETSIAPQISQEDVEEQRRCIDALMYQQKWQGKWTAADGMTAIDPADLAACVDLSLTPAEKRPGKVAFVNGGFDVGLFHDKTCFSTVGWLPETDCFQLLDLKTWSPIRRGDEPRPAVDLAEVKAGIFELVDRLQIDHICADPWQAMETIQELNRCGIPTTSISFQGKNADRLAGLIINLFRQRRVRLFPDEALQRQLLQLRLVQKTWGVRIEAPRTADGHCDAAIATLLALLGACEAAIAPAPCYSEPVGFIW